LKTENTNEIEGGKGIAVNFHKLLGNKEP